MKTTSNALMIAFILAVLLCVSPSALRLLWGNPTLATDSHMGSSYDYALYGKDPSGPPQDLYAGLLALTSQILGEQAASRLLPILLAIISLVIYSSILRNTPLKGYEAVGLLVLSLSPAFLYTAIISSKYALIQPLVLTGTYFLLRPGTRAKLISLVFFTIAITFDLGALVTLLTGVIIYLIAQGKRLRMALPYLVVSAASFLLFYRHSTFLQTQSAALLQERISDLGAELGISIFSTLIFLFALSLLWKSQERTRLLHLYAVGVIILAFFVPDAMLYANLLISTYAVCAIAILHQRKWRLEELGSYALLLLGCSLLFSGLVSIQNLAGLPPSKELYMAGQWLSEKGTKGSVLSDISHSHLLEYAGAQTFLNPSYDDIEHRKELAQGIWHAQDLQTLRSLLIRTGVTTILITEDMREQLWKGEDIELQFLLDSDETFKKEYSESGVVIWSVNY